MKQCICGSIDLIPIGSQNIKKCLTCGYENPWFLDKDQSSMFGDTHETIQKDYPVSPVKSSSSS